MNTIYKLYVSLLLLLFAIVSNSQSIDCFAVEFRDKKQNQFSIYHPEEFLSPKAIKRRYKQKKFITESDLPVSQIYLNDLNDFNLNIIYTLKWLNTAVVSCNKKTANQLKQMPFVKSVNYIGKKSSTKLVITQKVKPKKKEKVFPNRFHGRAHQQITMLKGDWLHEEGYRGSDITIAVLDAGFWLSDKLELLLHFNHYGNSLLHKDFVDMDNTVFETCDHGTKVLSIMAANDPGVMVGTAPSSTFICLKTEDIRGEFLLDEYNWAVGLEYADSIGVDIVVSGLGYTFFDDSSMNYTHNDLQQNAAISTQVANLASEKGIITVVSAGNEGNNAWKYVSCPADGIGVLAVGGVNTEGESLYFSSWEKEIKGINKPDVEALGEQVIVAGTSGRHVTQKVMGSSYSAPIVGGLVASLWSAFPNASNDDIMKAVRFSRRKSNLKIPNFQMAYKYLEKMRNIPPKISNTTQKLDRSSSF